MSEMVFAFGSNMCSGRFLDYGVVPERAGAPATLSGYELRFNKKSIDGSGKASVEPVDGAETWGVLYSIPAAHLSTLDAGEGPGYSRCCLKVRTQAGDIDAWVYVAKTPSADPDLRPYSWYKRFLVEARRSTSCQPATLERLRRSRQLTTRTLVGMLRSDYFAAASKPNRASRLGLVPQSLQ